MVSRRTRHVEAAGGSGEWREGGRQGGGSDLTCPAPAASWLATVKRGGGARAAGGSGRSIGGREARDGRPPRGRGGAGPGKLTWVEKMLHEHQRTSAPRAVSVSTSTAVWMVMCRLPEIRAPLKGCAGPNSSRQLMSPGISTSAMSISRRPKSASDMSFTL